MNATHNMTPACDPHRFPALLWVALVHFCCVIVIGTMGNVLALWCVATCTKTRRPMKVLLFSVFLPVLVMCLVTLPVFADILAAILTCDLSRISLIVVVITGLTQIIMVQLEQISISVIAVVRAVAIWAPYRPMLGIRGAVVLVVGTCIYVILAILGLLIPKMIGLLTDPLQVDTSVTIFYFVSITLPALITAASYILMIFIIQRNKRRLVAYQQQERETTTMDQATWAILAVFISNVVFSLPFSIYSITGKRTLHMTVIFLIIFFTHFMVDPLAYIWFNSGYREKVLFTFKELIHFITQSVLQTNSTTSRDQQTQQNSSPHIQEDTNL